MPYPLRTAAGAVMLMVLAAAPAAADVSYQPALGTVTRTVSVETRDLRLSEPAGRAALDRRIRIAARQACGYHGMYGLRQPADYVRCFAEARANALRAVAR